MHFLGSTSLILGSEIDPEGQRGLAIMVVTMNTTILKLITDAILTPAQAKSTYRFTGQFQLGKPVFQIAPGKVFNLKSAFTEKKLCDGGTFTLGLLCHFSCSFCYVEQLLSRHPAIGKICQEYGLPPGNIVIEKKDALSTLQRQLVNSRGLPRYADPHDRRVVFASPLVDVAATTDTARQTVAACRMILENTHWQIRLLSKSAALRLVAEDLKEHRDRVIYGLSTGTFDDRLAAAFEKHTSSPTARLRTLYWLQDHGFRTYAMICPSLPQTDYAAFALTAAEKVRIDRCEHVWAEVLNLRGGSLAKTCHQLRRGGFEDAADRLYQVSHDRVAWETYARETFLAHAAVVPPDKLRFLQYVQINQLSWWTNQRNRGAILLGKHAVTPEPETAPAQE